MKIFKMGMDLRSSLQHRYGLCACACLCVFVLFCVPPFNPHNPLTSSTLSTRPRPVFLVRATISNTQQIAGDHCYAVLRCIETFEEDTALPYPPLTVSSFSLALLSHLLCLPRIHAAAASWHGGCAMPAHLRAAA